MVVVVVVGVPTTYSTRYMSHYKLAKFCPDETQDKGNAGNYTLLLEQFVVFFGNFLLSANGVELSFKANLLVKNNFCKSKKW